MRRLCRSIRRQCRRCRWSSSERPTLSTPSSSLTTPRLTLSLSPSRAQDNGGSILAISSSKFAVIAGDTRQSSGYSIETRTAKRVYQLTPDCAIAVQGFMGDAMAFVKRLKQRLEVRARSPRRRRGLDRCRASRRSPLRRVVRVRLPVRQLLTDSKHFPSCAQWYGHTHNEIPSLRSIARLVQTMLYGKRFFPYYSYVIRASSFPSLSASLSLRAAS